MSISHRRASDTIVPLLDRPTKTKSRIVRTTSDASVCLRRNQLKDTIAQYETIVKHLKNYEKFMAEHPVSTSREKAMAEIIADQTHRSRQTQSLARHAGRTFTDFIMTDLLSTTPSIAHAASQTDLSCIEQEEQPLIQRLFQGKKTAFNPDDLQLQSVRIRKFLLSLTLSPSPYSSSRRDDGHVRTSEEEMFLCHGRVARECPLCPLIGDLVSVWIQYATKMIKIDRRGYKRHVRMLCLTSERVYIITKKDPYPKEAVRFKDILGITCSPLKDGFICLHTRETRDDRVRREK